MAAHLGIDLSSVQHAGSEARSRDHVEEMLGALERHVAEHGCAPLQRESALGTWVNSVSKGQNELTPQRRQRFDALVDRQETRDARARAMLDRIEEHVDVLEELPKRGAEDEEEAELSRWINNVSMCQNELSEENRARFDKLVNRRAWQRRAAWERVHEVKAFVEKYGRGPQRDAPDASPRERLLAIWLGNGRARGFEGLDERLRLELEVTLGKYTVRLQVT